jgi:hypothetical protein
MQTIETFDELRIPDYALPYLINGDSSGLDAEDKITIDNYMQSFYDICNGYTADSGVYHSVIFSTNDPIESFGYFSSRPAFGLACNVHDCTILIVK